MMNVSDLARLVGVTPDAVRYYTRIGLLHPVRDPNNGYRQFSSSDIDRHHVRHVQECGKSCIGGLSKTGNRPLK